jgi:hypothetical protein
MTDNTESWEQSLGIDGRYRRLVEQDYSPGPVQAELDKKGQGQVLCKTLVPQCTVCSRREHNHPDDHPPEYEMVEAVYLTTDLALIAKDAVEPYHRFRAGRLLAEQN